MAKRSVKPSEVSRTYECVWPCEQTYFAGPHAGPGPHLCHFCAQPLTLRPDGAEAYGGGELTAVSGEAPETAQMEMGM